MALESKQGRKPEIEEDRISNLPDGVLLHILSRLPTKTAVTTGRLSRRWRRLWQHLSVLDFADESRGCDQPERSDRFRSFAVLVNNVFLALNNPRGIKKMSLDCSHSVFDDKCRAYSVEAWVRAAIGPYLEELKLTFFADHYGPNFNLPQSLFTSTNLVSLSLSGEIDVNIQPSMVVSLPSLKTLLINVGYVEVSYLNAFLCGCPIIESLNLCFYPESLDKVCVPPSLRSLKITNEDDEVGVSLEINAPDLEYLNITRFTFGQAFSMYNLHNVVEAYLDVFPQSLGSVIPLHNLLGALSGTKHLVLNPSTTKWLLGEPHDLLFQEFQYLLRLELNLPCFNSNSLLTLLQKCPMLQVLIIQYDKEQSPILGWATLPSVPNCLVSHLTFIQFKEFQGFPDEVSFVELVLQKGLVLKTTSVQTGTPVPVCPLFLLR